MARRPLNLLWSTIQTNLRATWDSCPYSTMIPSIQPLIRGRTESRKFFVGRKGKLAPISTGRHSPDSGLRRGAWSRDEDVLLRRCIEKYGEGNWHLVPSRAGLNRCRKSCRLRWLNYLSPDIKRETFTPEEDDLIIRMHRILGNRWSLIAGRMLGRTANGVKNRWNSHLSKKIVDQRPPTEEPPVPSFVVVKPKAYRPTVKPPPWFKARQLQTAAREPAGNFTEEGLCISSHRFGREVEVGSLGGGLEAPHQTGVESSLPPQTLLDSDGKLQSPFRATAAPILAELEWLPEMLLPELDGKEFPLHAATVAPTQGKPEWLPEAFIDLDGKESSLKATTAPPHAEPGWEYLLSDLEFWSSIHNDGGGATSQPGVA
ncbi:unnamed protein product [Victoria cruziana]